MRYSHELSQKTKNRLRTFQCQKRKKERTDGLQENLLVLIKKVCSCKSFDAFKQELNDCCITLIVRTSLKS